MDTPSAWARYLSGPAAEKVRFLPLVDDPSHRGQAGWCTYAAVLEGGPEVEIFCGGMNTKHPEAAGVWRQGNLLHFGFQSEPATLNATGRALLENCIVYIARFTEDRPIGRTPSVFVDRGYPRPRYYLRRVLDGEAVATDSIAACLAPATREQIADLDGEAAREWAEERFPYLVAGEGGLLEVDEDARALGVAIDGTDFVTSAAGALGDPERGGHAVRTLARRVPEGPGVSADAAAWRAFVERNAPYLFFSEIGGQHWWVDPLARRRSVPTAELRGPARATATATEADRRGSGTSRGPR